MFLLVPVLLKISNASSLLMPKKADIVDDGLFKSSTSFPLIAEIIRSKRAMHTF